MSRKKLSKKEQILMVYQTPFTNKDEKNDEEKKDGQSPVVQQLLFDSRTIFITGGIDDKIAYSTCAQLVAMAQASDDPINVMVSSPGGHVESGDMIHDMIKFIKPKVRIIGTGWVASAGALIFVAADKKDRYCLPNTRFLLHQPSGGTQGQASDIAIQAEEILKMRERLNKIFVDATGQKKERIEEDTDRDFWLSAEDAVQYGLVNKIISSVKELK